MDKKKQKKKKKNRHVPVRMNLLFFFVFLLFSVLILRLGVVQIVSGEGYKQEVERTEDVVVTNSVPRGKIYDRTEKVIVDNVAKNAITYTPPQSPNPEDMMEVAVKLAQLIEMDTSSVRERDQKDYWILTNKKAADNKVTVEEEKEIARNKQLSSKEKNNKIYQMTLERISEQDLASLTEQDIENLAIYRELSTGYALTPKIIKNEGVSQREFAVVSENLSELPGINTTTDWERVYPFENTIRSILGSVSSSKQGIPSEMVDYYLSKDYSRNDRVGTSQLELQYEHILSGRKEKMKNVTKDGAVLETKVLKEGQRGKDIVITIDMELQQEVEKIVSEELLKNVHQGRSSHLDRAFVVMMDPNNGEVLALVGKRYGKDPSTGEYRVMDYALGTYTSFYEVGSAVKGATVLTGYMAGAISPGQPLVDEPIEIAATKTKASWFNPNGGRTQSMNDRFALEISSNSYMFKVAMKMAGNPVYIRKAPINGSEKDLVNLRNHFNQFGLGVNTGIDLPGEVDGYKGEFNDPGNLLDFAIGQFDTYTPLQLAQYVSTIANDGYRVQPQILKEVRKPGGDHETLGRMEMKKEPIILNKVNVTSQQLKNVQRGFYQVYHGSEGTAESHFGDAPYVAAGKSGTAESFTPRDPVTGMKYKTYNTTLIGYAPYDQLEIAYSTVVPASHNGKTDPYINKDISRRIMDKYFELKKQRDSGEEKGKSDFSE
ncbi:penicillin-binding protein 2 [Rossellomorea vietnamensis]|uniref:serine-type D-Ala-D-Ala carboxypeptidase n=1 Tax=Rossellomorea vietnamensis TaxID=218284 RepID=A0A5D4NQI9_9BACI|nr:penicillin-binding protein 2 [Rossellomorea vietnamensis]TYS16179.1 penicillin-binding protein 2 [Rossellomorea vietnamensis]